MANLVHPAGCSSGPSPPRAVVAAFWTPQSPLRINTRQRLRPPSPEQLARARTSFGRDVVSRLMAGAETQPHGGALDRRLRARRRRRDRRRRRVLPRLDGPCVPMSVNDALLALPRHPARPRPIGRARPLEMGDRAGARPSPTRQRAARVVRGSVRSIREKVVRRGLAGARQLGGPHAVAARPADTRSRRSRCSRPPCSGPG